MEPVGTAAADTVGPAAWKSWCGAAPDTGIPAADAAAAPCIPNKSAVCHLNLGVVPRGAAIPNGFAAAADTIAAAAAAAAAACCCCPAIRRAKDDEEEQKKKKREVLQSGQGLIDIVK